MKSQIVESKFTPITLQITFESQDELGEFYAMMNHVDMCNSVEHLNLTDLRKPLNGMYKPHSVEKIYGKLYKKLKIRYPTN